MMRPALLGAAIGKRDVDLRPAAVRSGRATLCALRKRDYPLQVTREVVHVDLTRLTLLRKRNRERYRLGLGREYKWLFANATLNVPTR